MNKIIILKHPSGSLHNSFDILVHKNHKNLVDFKDGYKMECQYVKKFLTRNPDYVYAFSEDNGHIPEFNWIDDWVIEKVTEGSKVISLDTSYPKDIIKRIKEVVLNKSV